jgi:gas vesicle protein
MADRDGGGFVWFLAGLAVGAAVGLLYAPNSGEETREALLAKAQEGTEKARQQARRVKDEAGEWIDRGREALNQQKEQIRTAYEAGRQTYNETTTAGGEKTRKL